MAAERARTVAVMDVAGYLVARTGDLSLPVPSNLKLQKLLYYSQGFALALRGEPLFAERLEAWDNGPVVRSVFREHKYGTGLAGRPPGIEPAGYRPEDRELLDAILQTYGRIHAVRLSGLTHAEPPWIEAFNTGRNTPLGHLTMKSFFSDLVELSRMGRTFNGRPLFPIGSLHHQDRRAIDARMADSRERIKALIRERGGMGGIRADGED